MQIYFLSKREEEKKISISLSPRHLNTELFLMFVRGSEKPNFAHF
jgi:hypothetical protein